jgi:tetratricopeptide (TPR) repeat protein
MQQSVPEATSASYTEAAQPKPSEAVQRLFDEANRLTAIRDYEGALKTVDRALELAQNLHDAVGEARAHRARALRLEDLKRSDEAKGEWRLAAEGWDSLGDGPGRIEALGRLGQLSLDSKAEEADALLEQAIALSKEERARPLVAAGVLATLGDRLLHRGNLVWARKLYQVEFEVANEWAPASLDAARGLDNWGTVAATQGNLQEATQYHQRALTIREQRAPNSLATAASLNNLGNDAREQGNVKMAVQYHQRALAIRERLVPDSLLVATSLNNLGLVAWDTGDLKAAAGFHQRALDIRERLAPDSLDVAMSLNNLGLVARDKGDLKAATEYHQRALVIKEKLAPNSLDLAGSLGNLGLVAQDRGDLKTAAEYFQRALDIQARQAPDSLDLTISLDNLGNTARIQGDLKSAEEYHARALAIKEKLGPNSLAVATSLSGVGAVADNRGDLKAAEHHLRQALAIRESEAPDSLLVAEVLNQLGNVSMEHGDLKEAAEYQGRALAIQQKLAPDSLDEAFSLSKLGEVAAQSGDLKTAENYQQRALAIQQKQAPDSLAVAGSLLLLGEGAYERGDLSPAVDYFHQALDIREKVAPDSLAVASALNDLGNVAVDQGDLKAAAEYLNRALAIKEKQAPDSLAVASSLTNLGNIVYRSGNPNGASDYYRKALAIHEKQAPRSLAVAASLTALGLVADAQGDLKAAQEYSRRALAIEEKQAPNSLAVAMSLHNLGMIANERGELKPASESLTRALAIQTNLAPDSLETARTLKILADLASKSGDLDSAERLASRAWDIVKHQAEAVTNDEARQAFGSSTEDYASVLLSIQLTRHEPEAAFATLEEGRAQSLAQLLFEKQEILSQASGDLWPRHQEALAKLHHAEETLNQAENIPSTSPEAEQHKNDVRRAYQQARDGVAQLWAEIQKREARAFVPTLDVAQAARILDTGTSFAGFSLQGDKAYVFVLSAGSAGVFARKLTFTGAADTDPLAAFHERVMTQRLSNLILGHWEGSSRPPESNSDSERAARSRFVAEGRELFDILFPGEIGRMVRQSRRLILSPDGSLWQLPFAALVTDVDANGNPHYLGEQVAIVYTPSLSLYAQLKQEAPQLKKGQRPEALVVGDPDFWRRVEPDPKDPEEERLWAGLYPAGKRPLPLRATGSEARVIAGLYGSAPLTGDQATEAELRRRIEEADVIHLATHGVLQSALPMSSGILLTPPEKEPAIGETNDDGALQAWEIFSQLKLRAELVVLSACDTARGEIVKGEGVVGLTRALEYAGARSVVATQWAVVEGESTTELVQAFHEGLRKGEAKDEALREAMARVREKYPQPFYWAPFILLGDPDNPNLASIDEALASSHDQTAR